MYFVSREKTINLDFYPAADGFLASDKLVEIFSTFSSDALRLTGLTMVDESGNPNSRKPMTFCQIADVRPACDLSKMDIGGAYHEALDSPNKARDENGQTVLETAIGVSLQPGLPRIFATRDIPNLTTIVSDEVRDACVDADLIGPFFIPVDDIVIVDFVSNGALGFSKSAPHWRERKEIAKSDHKLDRSKMFDPNSQNAKNMLADLIKNTGQP